MTANEFKAALIEHLTSLRAFARSLAGDATRADDLVQDAIVRALNNRDKFEPGSSMRAWLFTILRNHYFSELRKRKREVEDVDGYFAGTLASKPTQPSSADLEDFKRAFAKLSPDHREVLTLVGMSALSYEEAAEICGCAVGTVKSRVNRARKQLHLLLGLSEEEDAVDTGGALPASAHAGMW